MDFASLMSAQIAKAKHPPASAASKDTNSSETNSKPKYLKKAEIEAQREAEYRATQARLEAERAEKLERKRKLEDEEAARNREREEKRRRLAEESKRTQQEEEERQERERRKRLGLPEVPVTEDAEDGAAGQDGEPENEVDEETIVRQLREKDEPIRVFGESRKQRLSRWKKVTGQRQSPSAPTLSDGPIPTTLAPVPEADMKVAKKLPKEKSGRQYLFRQLASYFNMVLREWERAMAGRSDDVKSSQAGKVAFNAMIQARDNMRPLFKKMEKDKLEDSILEPVAEIVNAAQERRYVDANDGYLRLSIGKAAWPIGVTMVGIHERSAREKLHESDKGGAHIMSDETTRKFLQSIKRCLSFAQTRWPPHDQIQLMG